MLLFWFRHRQTVTGLVPMVFTDRGAINSTPSPMDVQANLVKFKTLLGVTSYSPFNQAIWDIYMYARLWCYRESYMQYWLWRTRARKPLVHAEAPESLRGFRRTSIRVQRPLGWKLRNRPRRIMEWLLINSMQQLRLIKTATRSPRPMRLNSPRVSQSQVPSTIRATTW